MTSSFPLQRGALLEHLLERHGRGERYLLAVSGGVDSLALLLLMLPEDRDPADRNRVVVGHVHHGTGRFADRAEAHVRAICEEYGVRLRVEHVHIDPEREKRIGFEAAAREQRRAALERMADRMGATKILFAHNRDDLAETVLIQLLRGSGLSGLTSLRSERGRMLRPLLDVSREDLRLLVDAEGLDALEDPANADRRFTRVQVRSELGPLIKQQFGDGAWENIARSARYLADAESSLARETDRILAEVTRGSTPRWLSIDATRLAGYFDELVLRVLRRALAHAKGVPAEQVYLDRRQRLRLLSLLRQQQGRRLIAQGVTLTFGTRLELSGFGLEDATVLELPGTAALPDGSRVTAEPVTMDLPPGRGVQPADGDPGFVELVDALRVGKQLTIRPWDEGDTFIPLGGDEPRRVVRRLRRSPSERLGPLWVVTNSDGTIIWVPGERIADSIKRTDSTRDLYRLRYDPPGTPRG